MPHRDEPSGFSDPNDRETDDGEFWAPTPANRPSQDPPSQGRGDYAPEPDPDDPRDGVTEAARRYRQAREPARSSWEREPADLCGMAGVEVHRAPLPDPNYVTQETDGPSTQPYRPMVAEEGGARRVNPSDERDLASWGATIAYLVDTDRVAKRALSEFDRQALAAHRDEPAAEPAEPVGTNAWTDELWARAIYTASLVEPYPSAVPTWDQLSERGQQAYVAQARRAVELVTQYLAGHRD